MNPQNNPTIKDNTAPQTVSDTRKLAIFENDSDFYVAHKKAEKLAVATYMISNFFTAEEPLKWSLRRVATELVKDTVALSSASLAVKDSLVRTLVAKVLELISLYEVAHKAGFISQMNFAIITSELEKILALLDKREGNQVGTKNISFNETFFAVQVAKDEVSAEPKADHLTPKTPTWSHAAGAPKYSAYPPAQTMSSAHVHTPHTQTQYAATPVAKAVPSFIKDNQNQKDIKDKRQQTIIALVKRHRTLTIKGFTGVIKDCSEKTIQRELLALVEKGVLKKEGERRWSTYSLA